MRRFFISGFERLLTVLTILTALAVAALSVRIAMAAQGNTQQYLTAAAIFLGGLLATAAVAGVSFLAIGMYENSRRMLALAGQGNRTKPLTASRAPAAHAPRRTAPIAPPVEEFEDEPDLDLEEGFVEDLPEPAQTPVPRVFSGRAMPKPGAHNPITPAPVEPPAPKAKAPVEPAPPAHPLSRGPRLVADRRPPR